MPEKLSADIPGVARAKAEARKAQPAQEDYGHAGLDSAIAKARARDRTPESREDALREAARIAMLTSSRIVGRRAAEFLRNEGLGWHQWLTIASEARTQDVADSVNAFLAVEADRLVDFRKWGEVRKMWAAAGAFDRNDLLGRIEVNVMERIVHDGSQGRWGEVRKAAHELPVPIARQAALLARHRGEKETAGSIEADADERERKGSPFLGLLEKTGE